MDLRKARPEDLRQIKALADAHKTELGFVLGAALEKSIRKSQLIVAINGTSIIGFIEYHHRQDEQTTLYHIVVEENWRHQGIGRALLTELEREAKQLGKSFILLKCPVDLPANDFYQQCGYVQQANVKSNGNKRSLNVWINNLVV